MNIARKKKINHTAHKEEIIKTKLSVYYYHD